MLLAIGTCCAGTSTVIRECRRVSSTPIHAPPIRVAKAVVFGGPDRNSRQLGICCLRMWKSTVRIYFKPQRHCQARTYRSFRAGFAGEFSANSRWTETQRRTSRALHPGRQLLWRYRLRLPRTRRSLGALRSELIPIKRSFRGELGGIHKGRGLPMAPLLREPRFIAAHCRPQ